MHGLTLSMLRLLRLKAKNSNIFKNHLNPVMLVFIGKLSLSTNIWVPICQGFSHFLAFFTLYCIDQISHQKLKGWGRARWWLCIQADDYGHQSTVLRKALANGLSWNGILGLFLLTVYDFLIAMSIGTYRDSSSSKVWWHHRSRDWKDHKVNPTP